MPKTQKRNLPVMPIRHKGKWNDGMYVKIYQLARAGLSDKKIAVALGATDVAFYTWKKDRPFIRAALLEGRKINKEGARETFVDYVYDRLSPEMQEKWDELNAWDRNQNSTARMNALLSDMGLRMRQQLFIHALIAKDFNPSEAMRMVGISKNVLAGWTKDPDFATLLAEIDWHKKNFLEAALIGLIKNGDTSATIFANKTQNADRGYSVTNKLKIEGNINHNINVVDVTKLDLSIECRREIVEAMERLEENQRKMSFSDEPLKLESSVLDNSSGILDSFAEEVA